MINIKNLKETYESNAILASKLLATECDGLFWGNVELLLKIKNLCEDSKPTITENSFLQHAVFSLSSDFINLSVASYKLLSNAFEKECFLMVRKGYETIWLLDTFTKKPDSIKAWIVTDKFKDSGIYPINIKKNGELYERLSKFVHPNSQNQGTYLGLLFVEFYTYQIFFEIVVCMCNMFESLLKALEKINNISINNYRGHRDWFSKKEKLLHLLLIDYNNNLQKLTDFGEEKLSHT